MSYLIRTGTGRNNISYGGGKSTKAKYLRRTGTGRTNISWIDINSNSTYNVRTNISWIDINSNSTYNVLERTSTGRNNIRWYNTQFSFAINISRIGIKVGTDFRHVTRYVPAHTNSAERYNTLTVGAINGNAITFSSNDWDAYDGWSYADTWAYYVKWFIVKDDVDSIGWDNIKNECDKIRRISYNGDDFYDVATREYNETSWTNNVKIVMNTGWKTKNQVNRPTVKIE